MALKFIITSKANLKKKYKERFAEIEKILNGLASADKPKLLDTKIIYVDDAASAQQFQFTRITRTSERNCKKVFDELYNKHFPAYMVIFGAGDVFPFQKLDNEVYAAGADDDVSIDSDLPYACNTSYNKKCSSFIDPIRVVGRIPDVPGIAGDISFVEKMIDNINKWKPLPKNNYTDKYFAITAQVWQKSTEESIENIFGNDTSLLASPPANGNYTKEVLSPLSHFYNCHGSLLDPNYYGQKGKNYPVSLNSSNLKGNVAYGTVIAAECCYGSQLFDPAMIGNDSIAGSYLYNDAMAFMGSTTIAYGPSEGQGLADLICQYFMINVHNGQSTGRAFLEARQKFLTNSGPHIDPHELKTIAQFVLLGDPSVQLVEDIGNKNFNNTIENRRVELVTKGLGIKKVVYPAKKIDGSESFAKNRSNLRQVLTHAGFDEESTESIFEIESMKTDAAQSKNLSKILPFNQSNDLKYRVYQKELKRDEQNKEKIRNIEVLVVKERGEQILEWKLYHSR
jgi:hypothetical protein